MIRTARAFPRMWRDCSSGRSGEARFVGVQHF